MSETVAVVNLCRGLADSAVAYWAEAAHQQAIECAAAWGCQPTPVIFVANTRDLPGDCRILAIRAAIDEPGALGYHDTFGGRPFYEIKASGQTSVTISHEVLEGMVDPQCNRWVLRDADHEEAVEICDRVEGAFYLQAATVLGETRQVQVSDYLLPSALDIAGTAPFDRLGALAARAEIAPGGYVIVRDITSGKVGDVTARVIPGARAGAALIEKLGQRGSRLLRRLRG